MATLTNFIPQIPDSGTESNYDLISNGTTTPVQLVRTATFDQQGSQVGTPLKASILNDNNKYILNRMPEQIVWSTQNGAKNMNWKDKTMGEIFNNCLGIPGSVCDLFYTNNAWYRIEIVFRVIGENYLPTSNGVLVYMTHGASVNYGVYPMGTVGVLNTASQHGMANIVGLECGFVPPRYNTSTVTTDNAKFTYGYGHGNDGWRNAPVDSLPLIRVVKINTTTPV